MTELELSIYEYVFKTNDIFILTVNCTKIQVLLLYIN